MNIFRTVFSTPYPLIFIGTIVWTLLCYVAMMRLESYFDDVDHDESTASFAVDSANWHGCTAHGDCAPLWRLVDTQEELEAAIRAREEEMEYVAPPRYRSQQHEQREAA